jgi:pilus assembly protein CpaB
MSSSTLKILALVTLVLALVLGYAAYRMSQGIGQDAKSAAQAGAAPAQMAVVALKPIPAFTPIPADAVALVPVAVLPEQYYARVEDVVGHAPLADIGTGVTLTQRHFRESNSLVNSIPPGFQAMSLEINDVIAVGGFVRPGDLVDVLLYIRSSGSEVQDSQARVLLRDARVLAYEDRVLNETQVSDGAAAADRQKTQQYQRRVRTAVIAVPETDTTRVMLGASLGELRLALRPQPAQPEAGVAVETMDGQPIGTVGETWPTAEAAAIPAEPGDENVVTLRELAGIRKRQSGDGAPAQAGSAVVIYRGSKVEAAGQ